VAESTLLSWAQRASEPDGSAVGEAVVAVLWVGQVPRGGATASADRLVQVALREASPDPVDMLGLAGRMAVGSSRLGNPVGQQIQELGRIDNTWRELGPVEGLAFGPAGLAVVEKGIYRSAGSLDRGLVVRGSDRSLSRSRFNGRLPFLPPNWANFRRLTSGDSRWLDESRHEPGPTLNRPVNSRTSMDHYEPKRASIASPPREKSDPEVFSQT
jgi:hypothetical protein